MPNSFIGNTHVLESEFRCKHCGRLPPGLFDEDLEMSIEYQVLFNGFEAIRLQRGDKPLAVTSGYRCLDYEKARYEKWVAAGKPGAVQGFLSVHLFGLALDLGPTDWADQANIVEIARTFRPTPRIGWKQYKASGTLMVHIDYGFYVTPSPAPAFTSGMEW